MAGGRDDEVEVSEGENARVASNPGSASLVVWEAEDLDDGGVFARILDFAGSPSGEVFPVNVATTEDQDQPDVAALANGDFVVVWRSAHLAEETVQARRFSRDGIPLGGEFRVDMEPVAASDPAIAADDSSGGFVIVWAADDDLFVRRFDSTGTALGDPRRFATALPAAAPAVGVAPQGDFLAVWEDGDDVRGQRFDAAGLPTGSEFVINATLAEEQSEPAVTAAGGGFLVVWRSEGQDDDGSAIYARRVEDLPVYGELQINTRTVGDQILPAVSTDEHDNILVAWQSEGGQDGSSSGIFARYLRPPRRPICPDFLVNVTTDDAQRNAAVAGGLRDFAVVWQTEPAIPPPGNVALIQTRRVAAPVFIDGFESGDLSAWSAVNH